jgi:hypothetical protein
MLSRTSSLTTFCTALLKSVWDLINTLGPIVLAHPASTQKTRSSAASNIRNLFIFFSLRSAKCVFVDLAVLHNERKAGTVWPTEIHGEGPSLCRQALTISTPVAYKASWPTSSGIPECFISA